MDTPSAESGSIGPNGSPGTSTSVSDLQLRWLGAARGVPICVMLSGSGTGCLGVVAQFLDWVRTRGDGVLRLAPVSPRSGQRLPAGLRAQIRAQSTHAPVLVCVEDGHQFAPDDLQSLVDAVLQLGNGRAAMVLIVAPPGSTAVPRSCLLLECRESSPPAN